jgi:aminoglycoside phosphotransferase (APT) family kinase protein
MPLEGFELDIPTAKRVIALADPSLRPEAVVRLTGGRNSAVFEARAPDGRAVVVKVYSDLFHWKMDKEIFVYDLLRQHGVAAPVPEILAADDSKTLLSHNVLVMTKLEGEHVLSILDRLDEPELVTINRQIGAILRTLHEVGFAAFGYVDGDGIVQPHETNLDYMRFQFEEKLREFDELDGDADLRNSIEHHVAGREELLADCARACFCHNDCHYGNVLVLPCDGGRRVSGLLDFENVLAGDPLLDLAKAHCYSRRRSEATLAALVDGYGDLRSNWREALDLYVLYHWVELWDWFASVGEKERLAGIAEEMRRAVSAG